MRVSLNWVKKYVDLPENITAKQIAYDLTLKTVEVESVENIRDKFHDIVVGKILSVNKHPNADTLKICKVDIGLDNPVQIVCGGSNLYENEIVVVSKPGAMVYWHGEGEPVVIKEALMRGESSYGMICASTEVFLSDMFPLKDENEIVDLKEIDCEVGQNICDALGLDDTIIEIDNKSLTNRPDLWGHYGIARELSVIYDVPLKKIEKFDIDKKLPKYDVEIKDTKKCNRYVAIQIDGVYDKPSPMWMQKALTNCGMRPINAIVDITNYVMLDTGQPLHAFDKTHVKGDKIIVRNAKNGEELILLDDNIVKLTEDDLVICDIEEPMALAGIKGGKKDSILPETKEIVLEIASFTAPTIRKSSKIFSEKTDASIRFEKNIDTNRVDDGISLALKLFKEIFEKCNIIKYNDVYENKTEREKISVTKEFLNKRLGKLIEDEKIIKILTSLGYDVKFKDNIYEVVVPVWRSTGDVSLKDDVLGDIARILGYNNFEAMPLKINVDHPVIQNDILLERRIKEYLSLRCGFYEIYTYPWIDEKYIKAAKIELDKHVRLATPPAPELANLRNSLIPGMLEAISKNLRYYSNFKMYEVTEVFEKGIYHESSEDETLPIHKKYLSGCIVDKNAKEIFLELKGVLENMSSYCHMSDFKFEQGEKPGWADINAYLNILFKGKIVGCMGLLSISAMNDSKIKRTNAALFEIDLDKIDSFTSRTNKYEQLPLLPLIEKDLSLIMNEDITWKTVEKIIKPKVKEVEFIEEYRGEQIPSNMKSIMLRIKISNNDVTMTSEEINNKINDIVGELTKKCGAKLREE